MKNIILLCSFLMALPALADDWTRGDSAREIAHGFLLAIDHSQTVYTARHPDRFQEYNKLMGQHPSVGRVNSYFLLAEALHIGISNALPHSWREPFQYLTLGSEIGAVGRNVWVGIRFSTP